MRSAWQAADAALATFPGRNFSYSSDLPPHSDTFCHVFLESAPVFFFRHPFGHVFAENASFYSFSTHLSAFSAKMRSFCFSEPRFATFSLKMRLFSSFGTRLDTFSPKARLFVVVNISLDCVLFKTVCERKGLATAEAQMEPMKAPCGASCCSRWLWCKASGDATKYLPH